MKTVIKSNQISTFEIAKCTVYSLRVLIDITIPVLFFIGISSGNQKQTVEPDAKQIIPTAQISAKPAVDMYRIGI
ncbi:MAG: hypothetical protein ABI863_12105 [Ginsengibacter sp.]